MDISHGIALGYAAKRWFVDRLSKTTIAGEMGVSRFKVARLIEEARERGLVDIRIQLPGGVDFELSTRVRERYGLGYCAAVHARAGDEQRTRETLAPVAATLMRDLTQEGDLVGITPGRTMREMGPHLDRLPHCDAVQLTGVAGPDLEAGLEVVGQIAAASGGRPHYLYCPLIVSDADTADRLRRQPTIRRTLDRMMRLDLAFVTIGSWNPPQSQVFDSMIDTDLRDRMLAEGIVAEVCATLLSADGRMSDALDRIAVSVTAAQLSRAREVIAIAGGNDKVAAVHAALTSGVVTSLVTDAATAEALLRAPLT